MFKLEVDLVHDKILKSCVLFAIPILISNLFQSFYNMMDIAVVSNYLGEASLSAIGSSSSLFRLITSFSLGLGGGFTIVLGRYYGSKDQEKIKKSMAASIVIGAVISIIFIIYAFVGIRPSMTLLNTPESIMDEAVSYLFVIVAFSCVMFLYNLLSSALRAVGNSTMPLLFLIFSSLLNIVFNIIAITVFHLGVAGTAYATIVSQAISSILCILYILKKVNILIPDMKDFFDFDKEIYKELLGQGLSMAMMMTIVNLGTVAMQSEVNHLGETIIAAHTTASSVSGFVMMPLVAISTSLSTFVAQNKGAKQHRRIIEGIKINNYLCWGWSAISILISFVLGPMIVRLISGSENHEILSNAILYMRVYTCFYPVLGTLFNLRNTLQGLGRKITPLISSCIELVGKILFAMFIIPRIGYIGAIFCEPIIWCIMTVELARSYLKQKKLLLAE